MFSESGDINIKTKTLQIHDIKDETAKTVVECIEESLKQYSVENKVIAFLADNAAVNFGSIRSRGRTEGNVHAMLSNSLQREIIPVGCLAHVMSNALSSAVDKIIPIDIQNVAFKIYQHFSIYTARTEKLKGFCDFIGCEMKRLLSHSKTRWLSLFPVIERLLQQYEALKSYFLSAEDSPIALHNFFKNETSEFWLLFLQPQAHLFYNAIQTIEATEMTAYDVSIQYTELLKKMRDRFETAFIPLSAQNFLRTRLQSENILTEVRAQAVVRNFYSQVIKYMEEWQVKLLGSESEKVFLLNNPVEYSDLATFCQTTCKLTNEEFRNEENNLFDISIALNAFLNEKLNTEPEWKKQTLLSKWRQALTHLSKLETLNLSVLKKAVEFTLVLPGTNADCERLFSNINVYWTDEKSHLEVPTLEAVMKVKEFHLSCEEFFLLIKDNEKLLENFLKSDKYASTKT